MSAGMSVRHLVILHTEWRNRNDECAQLDFSLFSFDSVRESIAHMAQAANSVCLWSSVKPIWKIAMKTCSEVFLLDDPNLTMLALVWECRQLLNVLVTTMVLTSQMALDVYLKGSVWLALLYADCILKMTWCMEKYRVISILNIEENVTQRYHATFPLWHSAHHQSCLCLHLLLLQVGNLFLSAWWEL